MPDEAQQPLTPENNSNLPANSEELNDNQTDGSDIDKVVAPEEPTPEVAFGWQASEFVHNHKSVTWYVVLAAVVVILAGLAAWLHFWLEIAVFVAMGIAVVVYARKPPRTLLYELSDQGISIDGKLLPFSSFRSFGVIPDEEWHSIDLEPTKRFNPRTVLLFNPEDLEQIVGHLELHLPREDRELDVIERITRYVRF